MLRIAVFSSVGVVLVILILCICICCIKKKNDKIRKQEQNDIQGGGTYISTDESIQDIRQKIPPKEGKAKYKKPQKNLDLSPSKRSKKKKYAVKEVISEKPSEFEQTQR